MAKVEINRKKIVKRLTREGWTISREGGELEIFDNPEFPGVHIAVPRHRTLSPGVARAIARAAGWI